MCRNIKRLYNFEPPVTEDEIQAAAMQYVRKVSGFSKPSVANQEAFDRAVEGVALVTAQLMSSLTTTATPRDRAIEAERAKLRSAKRFASSR